LANRKSKIGNRKWNALVPHVQREALNVGWLREKSQVSAEQHGANLGHPATSPASPPRIGKGDRGEQAGKFPKKDGIAQKIEAR
jgi:hypothetical protein